LEFAAATGSCLEDFVFLVPTVSQVFGVTQVPAARCPVLLFGLQSASGLAWLLLLLILGCDILNLLRIVAVGSRYSRIKRL
jgi:hypothetical protein